VVGFTTGSRAKVPGKTCEREEKKRRKIIIIIRRRRRILCWSLTCSDHVRQKNNSNAPNGNTRLPALQAVTSITELSQLSIAELPCISTLIISYLPMKNCDY
jgi:hypothetical protein